MHLYFLFIFNDSNLQEILFLSDIYLTYKIIHRIQRDIFTGHLKNLKTSMFTVSLQNVQHQYEKAI